MWHGEEGSGLTQALHVGACVKVSQEGGVLTGMPERCSAGVKSLSGEY